MSLCANFLGCSPENQKIYSQDEKLVYMECQDCGIIWRSETSFNLEQPYNEQYFDSKNYAVNRLHKVEKSTWLLDMALGIKPDIKSILEVGCSLGNTLEAASRRRLKHLGIDVSSFAVEFCQQKGLNASNETLEELLDQEWSFDLIYMQHVLEHFKDPFKVLRQCNKLLPSQGLVMILIPNSKYHRAKRLRERHRFYSLKGVGIEHYVYFNYDNLSRVLFSCGFKVMQANYPLRIPGRDSYKFLVNRIGRRMLSTVHLDQELVVIASKINTKVEY